jgi:23S rRNA (pseudouridine1915-N3)-methyltransferase
MNLTILAIGKMKKNSPEQSLIDFYVRNSLWSIKIVELDEKRSLTGDALKDAESNLLLKHVPPKSKIVVLDERGKNISSVEFSDQLVRWQDTGFQDVVFLIGGADGHSSFLRQKADLLLSFGKMTLPHMLMRVVLCEQLYRAYTISIGHPYHKV